MLIKDLSKEIDSKDMTAVRGGSDDTVNWITPSTIVEQGNSNAVVGNLGPVQIENDNSARARTDVSAPTNNGAIVKLFPFFSL
jgi:hypothetical protein